MTLSGIIRGLRQRTTEGTADERDAASFLLAHMEDCTTGDQFAGFLVSTVAHLRRLEDAEADRDDFEDKIDAAARDIEQAARFRRPDLIHEAYLTLTGSRLYT